MESFVTARCFQLLKIKNGLFRREALYNTGRTVMHLACSLTSVLDYANTMCIGTDYEKASLLLVLLVLAHAM